MKPHTSKQNADRNPMKTVSDPRFQKVHTDPRFRRQSKAKSKVKVDKRFAHMFNDPDFNVGSAPDKYGRKKGAVQDASQGADLRRFYRVEDGEDAVDNADVDGMEERLAYLNRLAKGEVSESSSSEEEEEEPEVESDGPQGEVEHGDASCRLALLNMDWDKLSAQDLFVLFNSFKLAANGSTIKSVTVYPSEFGLEEMAKESKLGPQMIWEEAKTKEGDDALAEDSEASESDEDVHSEGEDEQEPEGQNVEAIRRYEKRRLRYYFAVVVCDRVETAEEIYKECDAVEFERTSNVLELQFIPDSLVIEQSPRDAATAMPTEVDYMPPDFVTEAMQMTDKVACSWDKDDFQRQKTFTTWAPAVSALRESDFSAYLAPDDADEDQGGNNGKGMLAKRRQLLSLALSGGVNDDSDDDSDEDDEYVGDREISFKPNLARTMARNAEKRELEATETVFEKYQREKRKKTRERRKDRKKAEAATADGDAGALEDADVQMGENAEDPFAAWDRGDFDGHADGTKEAANASLSGRQRLKAQAAAAAAAAAADETPEDAARRAAELELLMVGDGLDAGSDDEALGKKKLTRKQRRARAKAKKKAKKTGVALPGQAPSTFDASDERFTELFSNPDFAVESTSSRFKPTEAMQTIVRKRLKQRAILAAGEPSTQSHTHAQPTTQRPSSGQDDPVSAKPKSGTKRRLKTKKLSKSKSKALETECSAKEHDTQSCESKSRKKLKKRKHAKAGGKTRKKKQSPSASDTASGVAPARKKKKKKRQKAAE